MAEAGIRGEYIVHPIDSSTPESLAQSYTKAAAVGEICASVWDGQRVNIITRAGSEGTTDKTYEAFPASAATTQDLEHSLNSAAGHGGRIISTVWDGQKVNIIIET